MCLIVVEVKDGFNEVMREQAWMSLQQHSDKTVMCCKNTEYINQSSHSNITNTKQMTTAISYNHYYTTALST